MVLAHNIKAVMRMLISIVFLTIIFIVVTVANPSLFLWEATIDNVPWQGSGNKEDPFLICNLSDLILLRDCVNNGDSFSGYYFRQICDIDLGSEDIWIPIGEFGSGCYFYGTYDGGSNTISHLNFKPCEYVTSSNGGLFGMLGGQVLNLGIESGCIEGDYVGSIASHSTGSNAAIVNCYNKASIIGNGRAGGICDNFSGGAIINCINYGDVYAAQSAQIVSYDAGYVINVFPDDNAVSANFRGLFANYVATKEHTITTFLNEGICYLYTMDVFPDKELIFWQE